MQGHVASPALPRVAHALPSAQCNSSIPLLWSPAPSSGGRPIVASPGLVAGLPTEFASSAVLSKRQPGFPLRRLFSFPLTSSLCSERKCSPICQATRSTFRRARKTRTATASPSPLVPAPLASRRTSFLGSQQLPVQAEAVEGRAARAPALSVEDISRSAAGENGEPLRDSDRSVTPLITRPQIWTQARASNLTFGARMIVLALRWREAYWGPNIREERVGEQSANAGRRSVCCVVLKSVQKPMRALMGSRRAAGGLSPVGNRGPD